MSTPAANLPRGSARAWALASLCLAVLAYVPWVLTLRNRVVLGDRIGYISNPGRRLAEAPFLWTRDVLGGAVEADGLADSVVVGFWYSAAELAGLSTWLAQRLLLASIFTFAGLGVLWLARMLGLRPLAGFLAGAVFMLGPYPLALADRPGLLLAWSVIGWLVGLAVLSVRGKHWGHPAAFALMTLVGASVSGSALAWVLVAPALWMVFAVFAHDGVRHTHIIGALLRITTMTIWVNLFWLVAVSIAQSSSRDIREPTVGTLQLSAGDALRGLSEAASMSAPRLMAGVVILGAALGGVLLVRWSVRAFVLLLIAVGGALAVGFSTSADQPLAFSSWGERLLIPAASGLTRSSYGVPVVTLGVALGVGIVAEATWRRHRDLGVAVAAGLMAAIATLAFPFLAGDGLDEAELLAADGVPDDWPLVAEEMQDRTHSPVVVMPISNENRHTWGAIGSSYLASATDRPTRIGKSGGRDDVVAAMEIGLSRGTIDPSTVGVILRMLGIGSLLIPGDLEGPDGDAADLLRARLSPLPSGLTTPQTFGTRATVFNTIDPTDFVRTVPAARPLVVSGDASGIVAAADAGLIDPDRAVLLASSIAPSELTPIVAAKDADLIVTDTNRGTESTDPLASRSSTVLDRDILRLPVDVPNNLGLGSQGHRFALLVNRDRGVSNPSVPDEESIRRRINLPSDRQFQVRGLARLADTGDSSIVDALLGYPGLAGGGVEVRASSQLSGDLSARSSRAVDGDPTTAWTASAGPQVGQWLEVTAANPGATDRVDLQFLADGRHSVPTVVSISANGATQRLAIPAVDDIDRVGAVQTVSLAIEPIASTRVRMTIDEIRPVSDESGLLPIAIAELGITGLQVGQPAETFDTGCRDDLISFGGTPLPVRIQGITSEALEGRPLEVADCSEEAAAIRVGVRDLITTAGTLSGLNIDRLVLLSTAGGGPGDLVEWGPGSALGLTSGPTLVETERGRTYLRATAAAADGSYWVILSERFHADWKASADGAGSLGRARPINAEQMGWLVPASSLTERDISFDWSPQRDVWIGLALSAIAIAICLGLAVDSGRRRRSRIALPTAPTLDLPWRRARDTSVEVSSRVLVPSAVITGVVAGLLTQPWVGLAAAAALTVLARTTVDKWFLFATATAIPLLLMVTSGDAGSSPDHSVAMVLIAILLAAATAEVIRVRKMQ